MEQFDNYIEERAETNKEPIKSIKPITEEQEYPLYDTDLDFATLIKRTNMLLQK